MRGIVKSFPGVRALNEVSFDVRVGEVHALVGENGAGKSTLMKVLAGAHRADAGEVYVEGKPVVITGPRVAESLGIGMIYQEFNLIPDFGVVENVMLGHEPTNGIFLDAHAARRKVVDVLAQLSVDVSLDCSARRLSVAEQQMIEICKSLVRKARLIVMDEPTAALTYQEIDALFTLMRKLKSEGVAFVYISHRLEELPLVADRITVLRDGRSIATKATNAFSQEEIIRLMVGREPVTQFPILPPIVADAPLVLSITALSSSRVHDVHFTVREGEIVGLAGLVGAGRTEIVRAIAGADIPSAGEIAVCGKPVTARGPHAAIEAGIALITEDRKAQGLVLGMSVRENVTLAHLEEYAHAGFTDTRAEREITACEIAELQIKTPSTEQTVSNLSGGTQQKVVLAKWLIGDAKVYLFDEPTRGIDVGAKAEIYRLMLALAARGAGIVMISSELPEVLGMSHRVLVVREGGICAEFNHADATPNNVMAAATGAWERRI
jgi:ribose transport system ATP-binding protein